MKNKSIEPTKEQIQALRSSDKDIKAGRLIPLEQLDNNDREWLSEEQKIELDKRLNEYQNGIGRNFSWEETVAMAKQALLNHKNNK